MKKQTTFRKTIEKVWKNRAAIVIAIAATVFMCGLTALEFVALRMEWNLPVLAYVTGDSRIIINLASKEYSKCIEKYLTPQDRYITIIFCELSGDKLVTKGTYAKMARGEMVRFIAENNIENPVEIQKFDRLGYSFRSDLSSDSEYVFERKIK